MKPNIISPDHFTVLKGNENYVIDLPDGDCQFTYDIRADGPVKAYLIAGDALIPFANGDKLKGRENVRNLEGLAIKCHKNTSVAVAIYHRLRKLGDQLDDKPIEVPLPEPVTIDIQTLVGRAVADALRKDGQGTQIDLEELIEDTFDEDIDPEFGPGHMEFDDPTGMLDPTEPVPATVPSDPGAVPDSSGTPTPGEGGTPA